MEEYRIERRIFARSPMGKRSRGRPRNRWREEVLKDIRVQVVMDRWAWHELVEKSKTHRGLQDERRRRKKGEEDEDEGEGEEEEEGGGGGEGGGEGGEEGEGDEGEEEEEEEEE